MHISVLNFYVYTPAKYCKRNKITIISYLVPILLRSNPNLYLASHMSSSFLHDAMPFSFPFTPIFCITLKTKTEISNLPSVVHAMSALTNEAVDLILKQTCL